MKYIFIIALFAVPFMGFTADLSTTPVTEKCNQTSHINDCPSIEKETPKTPETPKAPVTYGSKSQIHPCVDADHFFASIWVEIEGEYCPPLHPRVNTYIAELKAMVAQLQATLLALK